MNVNDYVLTPVDKVIVDFGVVDDEEYKVLCSTSFNYQGKACADNHSYVQVNKPWWMLFSKSEFFLQGRKTAAFEFPNQACLDMWMIELPNYFKG